MQSVNPVTAIARLIRLPNSFTVLSNIVAAHIVAIGLGSIGGTSGLDVDFAIVSPNVLFMTLVASLCFYHGGMILNDCIDYQEDLKERPFRPLPSKTLSLRWAWFSSIILFAFGLATTAFISIPTFIVGILLVIAIVLYNTSNRSALWGCVVMGSCRALNWTLAIVAVSTSVYAANGHQVMLSLAPYLSYVVIVGVYVFSLTLISRDETEARRPWLVSVCAVSMFIGVLYFLANHFVFNQVESASVDFGLQDFANISMMMLGLGVIFYRLWKLKQDYNSTTIQSMVMFLVLGLIPLDAFLVFFAGFPFFSLLILSFIIPGKLLAKKLYVT